MQARFLLEAADHVRGEGEDASEGMKQGAEATDGTAGSRNFKKNPADRS